MSDLATLERWGERIALSDKDTEFSYCMLAQQADSLPDLGGRSLVFCVSTNTIGMVVGLVGVLRKRAVPILLNSALEKNLYNELFVKYQPQFVWCPRSFPQDGQIIYEALDYRLVRTPFATAPQMAEDLALLLTTSGSTGSPKLVRQTYRNIESNTQAIVNYLGIVPQDRAITTLPMSYTYGLSILFSHLTAGAQIVLTTKSFLDKDFWTLMKDKEISTFGGVPYNYQLLDRIGFFRRDLPALRYLTQAGGRLGEELHRKFAQGMRERGKAFIVMYGATEATARMSYVPAAMSVEKAGSIGIPIPGGKFELIDSDGSVIKEANKVGELVYYGDNVTPGYAEGRNDLANADERHGRLETGDMALRDEDGYYYVVGRKKRFLKLFGNRVNLVEVEELLAQGGYSCACVGEDDHMRIYTTTDDTKAVESYLSMRMGIHHSAFKAIHIKEIPRNDAGKVLYSSLE